MLRALSTCRSAGICRALLFWKGWVEEIPPQPYSGRQDDHVRGLVVLMQDSLLVRPIYPAGILVCGHKAHPHALRVMPTSLLTGAVHQTPGQSSAVFPFTAWPPHHATPGAPRGMVFSTEMPPMRCTRTRKSLCQFPHRDVTKVITPTTASQGQQHPESLTACPLTKPPWYTFTRLAPALCINPRSYTAPLLPCTQNCWWPCTHAGSNLHKRRTLPGSCLV